MAGQPAAAPAAARLDHRVADLARVARATAPQPAVEDHTPADAGAHPDPEHVRRSPARTSGVLGERPDVGVVVHVDGHAAQGL